MQIKTYFSLNNRIEANSFHAKRLHVLSDNLTNLKLVSLYERSILKNLLVQDQ